MSRRYWRIVVDVDRQPWVLPGLLRDLTGGSLPLGCEKVTVAPMDCDTFAMMRLGEPDALTAVFGEDTAVREIGWVEFAGGWPLADALRFLV